MADLSVAVKLIGQDVGGLNLINQARGALGGLGSAVGSTMNVLGGIGLAAGGIQAMAGAAGGLANALGVGLQNEMEQTRASFMAFTKDASATNTILEQVRAEAARTPFEFREMATATASLLPVAKSSQMGLMDLVKTAEVLAASNPMQGLEGASFSLREAMTGDFNSIMERFNLSRSTINKLKDEGKSNFEIISGAMKEMGFDADLVSAKAETLSGRWSTFQDSINSVKMIISEPIFNIMKEALVTIQNILDANMGTIENWARTVAGGFQWIIDTAKGLGPTLQLVAGAFEILINTFVKGQDDWAGLAEILDNFFPPSVSDAITAGLGEVWMAFERGKEIVKSVGDIFKQALGGDIVGAFKNLTSLFDEVKGDIIQKVLEWGQAFVGWIAPHIPVILGQLQGLIMALGEWFIQSRISMVEQLAGWAAAFIEWIAPMMPDLLAQLGVMATNLLTWLVEQVNAIAAQLQVWADTFIAWVAPFIPPLLAELGNMATSIIGWIIEQAPVIISQLAAWATAFIAWIAPQIPILLQELLNITTAILGFIEREGPNIAKNLGIWAGAFVGWIASDVIPVLVPALAEIIKVIGKWAIDTVPKIPPMVASIGSAFIDGILQGLGPLGTKMGQFMIDKINEALRNVMRNFGIQSPSTWTGKNIGEPMAEGIVQFFIKKLSDSSDVMNRAIRAVVLTSLKYGMDPRVTLALAGAESNYGRNIVGDNGSSVGIFQLNEAGMGSGMSFEERATPEINTERFLSDPRVRQLYDAIIGGGGLTPSTVSEFGGRAEVSKPEYWQRYGQEFQQILSIVGQLPAVFEPATAAINDQAAAAQAAVDPFEWIRQRQEAWSTLLETDVKEGSIGAQEALMNMAGGMDYLQSTVADGTTTLTELQQRLIILADAVGLADEPNDRFQRGLIDQAAAMEELINKVAEVDPRFRDLQAYMQDGAVWTSDVALQFLNLVESLNDVPEAASTAGAAISDAVKPTTLPIEETITQLSTVREVQEEILSVSGRITQSWSNMPGAVEAISKAYDGIRGLSAQHLSQLNNMVDEWGDINDEAREYIKLLDEIVDKGGTAP